MPCADRFPGVPDNRPKESLPVYAALSANLSDVEREHRLYPFIVPLDPCNDVQDSMRGQTGLYGDDPVFSVGAMVLFFCHFPAEYHCRASEETDLCAAGFSCWGNGAFLLSSIRGFAVVRRLHHSVSFGLMGLFSAAKEGDRSISR